jgi:hypothetical protein
MALACVALVIAWVCGASASAKITTTFDSVAPKTHLEAVRAFEYVTTYSGRYVFDYHYEVVDIFGQTDGIDELDVYSFSDTARELFVPEPKNGYAYKQTVSRNVSAVGHRTITDYNTAAGPPETSTCQITDDGKGDQQVSQQHEFGPPPDEPTTGTLKSNPLVLVSWRFPDDVNKPGGRIVETGTNKCTGDATDPPYFLGYTLQEPCNTCVGAVVKATAAQSKELDEAWEGSALAHLKTLASKKGYSKPIHVHITGHYSEGRKNEQLSYVEQGYVHIEGTVTSHLIAKYVTAKAPGPPDDCKTKVGDLLNPWGLGAGRGSGKLGVLPPGIGDPLPVSRYSSVPLPYSPCTGTVKLDVSGVVLSTPRIAPHTDDGRPSAHAAARKPVLLASSPPVHITAGFKEPDLRLTLTPHAIKLLSASHPPIQLTAKLTLVTTKPRHRYTSTGRATLPSTSQAIPPLP